MNRRIGRLAAAVLLLTAAAASASGEPPPDLPLIRASFHHAVEDPAGVDELARYIEGAYGPLPDRFPPVVRAYYASVEGLKGRHARGLREKLDHTRRAIALFRDLVEANPDSLEIRFLRFTLYSRLPPFFGVRPLVSADLPVLVALLERERYDDVPSQVQRAMAAYLLENAELDRRARERLEKLGDASHGG